MECKSSFCFISVLLIFIPGVSMVMLVPSANPVAAGQNITMTLSPVMSISAGTWLFQGSILAFWYPGDFILGEEYAGRVSFNVSTLQLSLRSVQVNDTGLYVLQGARPRVQAEVTLSVQEPIRNVSLTASQTDLLEFNSSVSFTCSARGTPLAFSWYNGSSEVTAGVNVQLSSNGSALTISNVTRYDRGPFSCVVTNGISNGTSGSLNLNISYGPSNLTVTVSPEKLAYVSGSNLSVSCSADSSPPALLSWSYDGLPLNKTGPTLQLMDASQNETGTYTCTAHNTVTLRYVAVTKTIRILDAVTGAEVMSAGEVPMFNMSFTLTCDVTGAVDTVYWTKDGSFLSENKTLWFDRLTLSDDGRYQCVAVNAVSNKTSRAYELAVNYGPWNVTVCGPAIAQTDSSITLTCSASSRPASNYSWYFNGSKMAEGAIYKTGALWLNSSGEYTCTAHNIITGINATATWNLTVIVGISSVVVTSSMSIPLASKPLQLFCNVTGAYNHISWLKDNRTFSPTPTASVSADSTALDFRPLQVSDDGSYQCAATNIAGQHVSKPHKLTANYGPVDLRITATKEIMLTCEASSQPPSVYHWILNDNTSTAEGPTVAVPLLTPAGSKYTCVARNPLTNATLSGSYIFSDDNSAAPLQTTALLSTSLLLPLLTLWL